MKTLLTALMAVAIAGQPLMLQAAQAPAIHVAPSQTPAKPAKPKVAGAQRAMGAGVDMETLELSLLLGGMGVALLAGGGGNGDHACRCHGGGGTGTGTTGTH